ncbi:hypothetical protein GBAR_LOCUS29996 [Geodia barretti]|uniref:Uncharacterized protein n=1 Tax=Geodia barretti TaxID=519541 RepID=A0AA35TV10_GEOBA|nr:hypothetical protein GBAR_LOCUS29996 [Geodia barretti]
MFEKPQRVELRRANSANSPTGIYRCEIPTIEVHDENDTVRATVYVGLYTNEGGGISISGGVTFDPDQLTLTCISTGGPATTVTWTRDSTTVTQGTESALNDPVTAQYTHTLTVTALGTYTCTVSNDKPSTASAKIALGPSDVTAVQDSPTSIGVSWTPPSQPVGITGYRISYTGGSSVNITGEDSYRLTQLTNGETYTITIRATSTILSESVHRADVPLGKYNFYGLYANNK